MRGQIDGSKRGISQFHKKPGAHLSGYIPDPFGRIWERASNSPDEESYLQTGPGKGESTKNRKERS